MVSGRSGEEAAIRMTANPTTAERPIAGGESGARRVLNTRQAYGLNMMPKEIGIKRDE